MRVVAHRNDLTPCSVLWCEINPCTPTKWNYSPRFMKRFRIRSSELCRRLVGLHFCTSRTADSLAPPRSWRYASVTCPTPDAKKRRESAGRSILDWAWRGPGSYFARFGNVTNWCSDMCNTSPSKKPWLIKPLQYITRLVWYVRPVYAIFHVVKSPNWVPHRYRCRIQLTWVYLDFN